MNLVAYSDSEGSDVEDQPKAAIKAASKATNKPTATNFVVSKSNSHKIQVNLGELDAPPTRDANGEPPPKRAKIGIGSIGGFNVALPPPKREAERNPTSNGTARKVFALKTGTEPAFSREADAESKQHFVEQTPPPQPSSTYQNTTTQDENTVSEPSEKGNSMQFKPLSVTRSMKKSSSISAQSKSHIRQADPKSLQARARSPTAVLPVPRKPKASLFSAEPATTPVIPDSEDNTEVDLDHERAHRSENSEGEDFLSRGNNQVDTLTQASSQPQSLDSIASDLNLSAADRRRLFGREGKGSTSAINIVNFNTDQEYAANESLRASSEQTQHHAVRGIAPGKHSLKQLINAATTQKDVLEEKFASGKSNKREAGSRYGW